MKAQMVFLFTKNRVFRYNAYNASRMRLSHSQHLPVEVMFKRS